MPFKDDSRKLSELKQHHKNTTLFVQHIAEVNTSRYNVSLHTASSTICWKVHSRSSMLCTVFFSI